MIIKKLTITAVAVSLVAAVAFFKPTCSLAADYATRLIEYCPAPGQFVNLEITTDPSGALGPVGETDGDDPATEGIVSLGSFGGYIVLGFDRPIKNDPQHRYGVDFTVIGNAVASGASACEPGAVQVMKDVNGNGMPDDGPWLELAGSDYWLASTRKNVTQTYVNPMYTKAHSVAWMASDGQTGAVLPVDAHTQPYYPDVFWFDGVSIDHCEFLGNCILGAVDRRNPMGVTSYRAPAFGYADCHSVSGKFSGMFPQNPYYADENGAVADGFDLSWAVDADGNHVELDEVDFVKIYTAGSANLGWLGEWSTEVDGIVLSEPDDGYVPTDYYLHYIGVNQAVVAIGATARFQGLLFKNGRPQTDCEPHYSVDDPSVGTIDGNGVFTALKEGRTTVRFSCRDDVREDAVEVSVVSLTGVVAGTGTKASAVATASCIVGESMFINVESTCNYESLFPGSKGDRYTHDTYTWYNSNPSVGSVDEYGTFQALSVGSTVLTACSNTRPDLYAEIKVTVNKIPAVVLSKTSVAVTEDAPTGNWSASTLFKSTNRSSVVIKSVVARNGLFPFELRGNRIVYDCSSCDCGFEDVLDMVVTHYGVEHEFTLPVSYVKDSSSSVLTSCSSTASGAVCGVVHDIAGNVVAILRGSDIENGLQAELCAGLPKGIYVVQLHYADGRIEGVKVVK